MTNMDAEGLARSMLAEAFRRGVPVVLSPPLAKFARKNGFVEGEEFVESQMLPRSGGGK